MPDETPSADRVLSYAEVWDGFLARDAVVLAEQTIEPFARGRAQHLTFLVRVEDAAARAYAAGVIDRIADVPGVEPFPDWYWHVTIKGAGFQTIKRVYDDDILRQDVPRMSSQAKAVFDRASAFDAEIGPPNGFPGGVILEVHDGGAVRALNEQLLEHVTGIPRYEFDGAPFLPHISITRFRSAEGLALLKERLAALRTEPPGPRLPVRRIELVKAWVTEEVPELETLASYQLRPAAGGAAP